MDSNSATVNNWECVWKIGTLHSYEAYQAQTIFQLRKQFIISLEESWSYLLVQNLLQGAVGDIFGVPGFLVASFRRQDARADAETIDLDFGKIHSAYIDILKVDR